MLPFRLTLVPSPHPTAGFPEAALHKGTSTEVLAWFDSLEPVEPAFLWGRWRGVELRTGHPLEGVLEAAGWFGKEFLDPESVHPLLFRGPGGTIFPVAPSPAALWLLTSFPWVRNPVARPLLRAMVGLLRTRSCQARVRMVEVRGRVSAAMLYDRLPILDAFRRVDGNTLLGMMDQKGDSHPYFFLLKRVSATQPCHPIQPEP